MNLNLSDWDWLNAALGVLFLYRGIRDLYNGTGTGWSSEDEKKHFRKFYGIAVDPLRCTLSGQHFSAKDRAAEFHFDGGDARVVRCPADLVSVLCPE